MFVIPLPRVRVPAACSAFDGIWLLAMQIDALLEELAASGRLLRGPRADEARRLIDEKRELRWRLRAILDGNDARHLHLAGLLAALRAGCGLEDLAAAGPGLPGLFAGRGTLRVRLERLAALEQRLLDCATQLRERFGDDLYRDEFRVGAQLADAHLAVYRSW
jgi:hypothetical protein